jgi:hypothetical protein
MSRGRRWIVALSVIAACTAAGAGYVITRGWPGTSAAAESTSETSGTASAPTPAEQTAVAPDEPNPSSGQTVATDEPVVIDPVTQTVPVVLTYSAWSAEDRSVLAGGYVSGVIEDGGICTLTLTQGSATVTVEGPAMPDASTTVCGGLTVPGDRLAAGTWRATLSYASPAHAGTSATAPVEVAA